MKRLLLVAFAGTASMLFLGASPAAAKTPCWKKVVSDWYDNGRIDKTYAPSCYREALRHLPEDVQSYANARDVITRALQDAIVAGRGRDGGGTSGGTLGATAGTPGGNNRNGGLLGIDSAGTGPRLHPKRNEPSTGLFSKAINRLGPSNADAIPIPLIVLGALAILLLAAGAAGIVARKIQEHRVPRPATVPQGTDRPPDA